MSGTVDADRDRGRQRRRRRRPVHGRRCRRRRRGHRGAVHADWDTSRPGRTAATRSPRSPATPPATRTTSATVTVTVNNPPPTPGLVAAYGFEEAQRHDRRPTRSGHGNTGTISGATASTAGRFGKRAVVRRHQRLGDGPRRRSARPLHRHDARGVGQADRADRLAHRADEGAPAASPTPCTPTRHQPPERARPHRRPSTTPAAPPRCRRRLDAPRGDLRRRDPAPLRQRHAGVDRGAHRRDHAVDRRAADRRQRDLDRVLRRARSTRSGSTAAP